MKIFKCLQFDWADFSLEFPQHRLRNLLLHTCFLFVSFLFLINVRLRFLFFTYFSSFFFLLLSRIGEWNSPYFTTMYLFTIFRCLFFFFKNELLPIWIPKSENQKKKTVLVLALWRLFCLLFNSKYNFRKKNEEDK